MGKHNMSSKHGALLFSDISGGQLAGGSDRWSDQQCSGGVGHDTLRRGQHSALQPASGPPGQGERLQEARNIPILGFLPLALILL